MYNRYVIYINTFILHIDRHTEYKDDISSKLMIMFFKSKQLKIT